MIAMILAAGRGERLRPITERIPKALVEVHGRSLIERHLEAMAGAGIETVVINLGWLGERIAARLGSGSKYGVNIVYSPEGDDILETGGGIQRALPLLGREPFLVVNGDVYTDMPLPPPLPAEGELGHLVLVPKPAHRKTGDFGLENGKLVNDRLVNDRLVNDNQPALTFSGIAVYRPEFFAGCEPGRFPLAPLLRAAADKRQLGASVYAGVWEDVGTPDRLAELNGG